MQPEFQLTAGALPRRRLLLWVPSPLDRSVSQVSGAPERGRQLGSQSWGGRGGSRWPLTHCPVRDANWQMDTDQGDGGHKSCTRAAREIRQERQNRPKALSFRKLCFDFSERSVLEGGGKGRYGCQF